jgi:Fe-S-cluster containining protein
MHIDESRVTVIYDQTEIVEAVKNLTTFINDRINSETKKLTQIDAIRKLKRLYEKLDNALKPLSKAVPCKAGCAYCCHTLVLTSQLEIEMIKEYITSRYSDDKLSEFMAKIEKHKNMLTNIAFDKDGIFSEEATKAYLSSNIPCAFLDENNRCSIYESRPFICRKYLVFNSPDVCANPFNKTNQYYSGYHSTVKEAIIKLNQLTYGMNYKYKHLQSWFVKI